jgi:hypothetical protein
MAFYFWWLLISYYLCCSYPFAEQFIKIPDLNGIQSKKQNKKDVQSSASCW